MRISDLANDDHTYMKLISIFSSHFGWDGCSDIWPYISVVASTWANSSCNLIVFLQYWKQSKSHISWAICLQALFWKSYNIIQVAFVPKLTADSVIFWSVKAPTKLTYLSSEWKWVFTALRSKVLIKVLQVSIVCINWTCFSFSKML